MAEHNLFVCLEAGGKKLTAGTGFDEYKLYELEGISGLDFDFKTASAPQSPSTFIYNKKPLPRKLSIGVRTDGANRSFLAGFFNPFVRGTLTVEWNGITRFIHYYPYPARFEQPNIYSRLCAEAELFCAEPYWLDPDDFGKNIACRMPLTAFPFVMLKRGVIPDYKIYNQEVTITNMGDVPSPLTAVFTAAGPVTNPRIEHGNGEIIRVITDMKKGDAIEISTDPDDLRAQMNGADILNDTDPKMTFFQLAPGDNPIKYGADYGTSNLNVYIYSRARYVGL